MEKVIVVNVPDSASHQPTYHMTSIEEWEKLGYTFKDAYTDLSFRGVLYDQECDEEHVPNKIWKKLRWNEFIEVQKRNRCMVLVDGSEELPPDEYRKKRKLRE